MKTGIVKWWSRKRGYGFLMIEGMEQDVFVHHEGVIGEGYKNLLEGNRVCCKVIDRGRGPLAVDVVEVG